MIREGDYVIPAPDDQDLREFPFWDRIWPPCRVIKAYKNGNIYARTDDLRTKWWGPADSFQLTDRR